MARINVEDSIFRDQRWFDLVLKIGCPHKSLGLLVNSWFLAQKHFLTDQGLVPFDEWPEQFDVLLEVRLAKKLENGIRVSGSDAGFGWLKQKSEAGTKSSTAKLEALKKAREARWNSLNGSERESTALNGSEPLTLPQSLTPTLPLKNNGETEPKITNYCSLTPSEEEPPVRRAARVRADFDLAALYDLYPRKVGKTKGMTRLKTVVKTQQDYDEVKQAINAYKTDLQKNGTEAQYIKHFSTFMNSWRDWLDSRTGTADVAPKSKTFDWSKVWEEVDKRGQG